mgnify:CR=1 FL=1
MLLKILIAEDDLVSRKYLNKVLNKIGECDLVVDGKEAIDAYMLAISENSAYDLICLDIMMPKIDGTKVLKTIRELEDQQGINKEKRVPVTQSIKVSYNESYKAVSIVYS